MTVAKGRHQTRVAVVVVLVLRAPMLLAPLVATVAMAFLHPSLVLLLPALVVAAVVGVAQVVQVAAAMVHQRRTEVLGLLEPQISVLAAEAERHTAALVAQAAKV
jgi:hypothetical protein